MSGFSQIVGFFNSKKSNKIFTRKEYFTALKDSGLKPMYMDVVRRYLQCAGYLSTDERGVYRKLKPIPKNLTLPKLQDEAYPQSIEARRRTRQLASEFRYKITGVNVRYLILRTLICNE